MSRGREFNGCGSRFYHWEVGGVLAQALWVPSTAPPRTQPRTVPDKPPEDILALVVERTGLSAARLEKIWKTATDYNPPHGFDPYSRWWTHRSAVFHLSRILEKPLPLETFFLREVSGYAALLWPILGKLLRAETPITRYLKFRPEEPSHLSWMPATTYVGVCISLYPDNRQWVVVLNAAVEHPSDPWVTIERKPATSIDNAARTIERAYTTAMDEVDTPVYAAPDRQPLLCRDCHWWCGWDGVCRRCNPIRRGQRTAAWKRLEQLVQPIALPSQVDIPGEDSRPYYRDHAVTQVALNALKARYGHALLSTAEKLVQSLDTPTLPGILHEAGFSLHEAWLIIHLVQRNDISLSAALRKVLTN